MQRSMKKITVGLPEHIYKAGGDARRAFTRMLSAKSSKTQLDGTDAGSNRPSLLPALKEMWERDVNDLPVAKDIARLARRVEIVDEVSGAEIFKGGTASTDDGAGSLSPGFELRASAEILVKMLLALVKAMEATRLPEVEKEFTSILAEASDGAELSSLAESFIAVLGADSPTVLVLKTIHQEIVLFCTSELKESLTKKYLTKDVRTPEGWRVLVLIGPERVQVVHIRREQSIDGHGDHSNHWEFQWELRMLFGGGMSEMYAAQVRITDLFLAETINKALEDELRRTIVGDVIVM